MMSDQERELLMRLLKQSVLTLCRETVSFRAAMAVDGLICITVEDNVQPIIVKIHEQVIKSHPSNEYGKTAAASKRKRKALFQLESLHAESPANSSEGLNDACMDMSDISMEDSQEVSEIPEGASHASSRPPSANCFDGGGGKTFDRGVSTGSQHRAGVGAYPDNKSGIDEEVKEGEGRISSPEAENASNETSSADTSLSHAFMHNNSTAMSHPEGLLCKRCFTVVPDAASLDNHNLKEHALFTCKICFKGFTARNNLKRHFRLHTGVRPYKCTICGQGFTRKDDLKAHVLRHSYSKPFRCGICGKGYTDRSCVRNHMAKEHQSRLLHVCPQCGEGFDDSIVFSRHKKSHPEFKNYQCDVCSFTGISSLDLLKHALIHSTKRFSCRPCGEHFSDPFEYSSHLKKHKSDESFTCYVCCFCPSELGTYEQFVRHEYCHAQSKTHSCYLCSKPFRYPSDLKAHIETHSEPMNLATESRDNNNVSEADVVNGSSSSQYWCTECQLGFSSEESFHKHIYEEHEGGGGGRRDKDSESSSVVQPVMIELKKGGIQMHSAPDVLGPSGASTAPPIPESIPMVDLSLTKVPNLLAYDRKPSVFPGRLGERDSREPAESVICVNGDRMSIKQEVADVEEELQALREEYLQGETMNSADRSSDHENSPTGSTIDGEHGVKEIVLERIHIRSPGFERVITPEILFRSQQTFMCQVCSDTFTDFTEFEYHSSSLHRRFVCEYCGKIFTAKPNRERHVRYHTGERPYKCDLCDQTFFRGDDLKYHRTTRHSGVKPFRCNSCGMSFSWPKDLERHIRHYCH